MMKHKQIWNQPLHQLWDQLRNQLGGQLWGGLQCQLMGQQLLFQMQIKLKGQLKSEFYDKAQAN